MKIVQVHRKFGKPWSEDQTRKRGMVKLLREKYDFTGVPHPPKAYLLTDILESVANASNVDGEGFSFFSQESYCAKGWAHSTTVRKALLWLVAEGFLLAHKDNKMPYLGAKRFKLNAALVVVKKKEQSASDEQEQEDCGDQRAVWVSTRPTVDDSSDDVPPHDLETPTDG